MKTGVVLALVALAACASVGTAIRLDGQLFSFGSAMPQVCVCDRSLHLYSRPVELGAPCTALRQHAYFGPGRASSDGVDRCACLSQRMP